MVKHGHEIDEKKSFGLIGGNEWFVRLRFRQSSRTVTAQGAEAIWFA